MSTPYLGCTDAFNHLWRDKATNNLATRFGNSMVAGAIGLTWGYPVTQVEAQEYLVRNQRCVYPNRSIHNLQFTDSQYKNEHKNKPVLYYATTQCSEFERYRSSEHWSCTLDITNCPAPLKTVLETYTPAMQNRISIGKGHLALTPDYSAGLVIFNTTYTINIDKKMYVQHSSGFLEYNRSSQEGKASTDCMVLARTLGSLSQLQKAFDHLNEAEQARISIYRCYWRKLLILEIDKNTVYGKAETESEALGLLALYGRECKLRQHRAMPDPAIPAIPAPEGNNRTYIRG